MMKVLCISGFLGANEDWDFLDKNIFDPVVVTPMDLKGGFAKASEAITKMAQDEKVQWIMGYSMGGRLALSSIVSTDVYKGAVIFSSHYGLATDLEKKQRLNADAKWAGKFSGEAWEKVVPVWNSQEIFKNSKHPKRVEKDYPRQELTRVLTEFSLGAQPNYRDALKNIRTPILFVAGSKDEKYKQLANEATKLNSKFKIWAVEGAGHRVIFDTKPRVLNDYIINFMESV